MPVVAVIPARYASVRFPGKPLVSQTGKPLIQHVVERVRQAKSIDRVLVATDDERILAAVRGFDGECVMTSPVHPSGTDRIAEVARSQAAGDADLILNVQGDEPEIEPEYLDRLVTRMQREDRGARSAHHADKPKMGTLACPFPADADPQNPNMVKVVVNRRGEALYFSRSAIPYERDRPDRAGHGRFLLHLGVYAYRRDFLLEFAGWSPTPLEQLERLEQLRALEHGVAIAIEIVPRAGAGIDTPEEYERFVSRQRARA